MGEPKTEEEKAQIAEALKYKLGVAGPKQVNGVPQYDTGYEEAVTGTPPAPPLEPEIKPVAPNVQAPAATPSFDLGAVRGYSVKDHPAVIDAIRRGMTGQELDDFKRFVYGRTQKTPEQLELEGKNPNSVSKFSSTTTVAGYGGGGGGQPFQPNDPSFKDLPFPLVEPYEYRALLQNRGMDPSAIETEVGRYEAWRQTAPGLGDQIESDKVRSQQNAYGIEGERLGGLRAVGQQKIGAYEQMLPALQDVEAQRQKAWDDADRQYQDHLKAYDAEITDLHNTTINPTRIFDTNESNRALAAIAVGLGEFANQFTGHGNAALKIVSDAIDRDVEAQKAGVNTKYMALGVRSNLLNRLHDRFGDVNMAAQAAKAGMYEQLAMYTEYLGAQIGDKNVVAQAKKNVEELRALSTQAKLAFDLAAQQRADQQKARADAWAYAASQQAQQDTSGLLDEYLEQRESGAGKKKAQMVELGSDDDKRFVVTNRKVVNPLTGEEETLKGFVDNPTFAKGVQNTIDAGTRALELIAQIRENNKSGAKWFGADPVHEDNIRAASALGVEMAALYQGDIGKTFSPTEKEAFSGDTDDLLNTTKYNSGANVEARLTRLEKVIKGRLNAAVQMVEPGRIVDTVVMGENGVPRAARMRTIEAPVTGHRTPSAKKPGGKGGEAEKIGKEAVAGRVASGRQKVQRPASESDGE